MLIATINQTAYNHFHLLPDFYSFSTNLAFLTSEEPDLSNSLKFDIELPVLHPQRHSDLLRVPPLESDNNEDGIQVVYVEVRDRTAEGEASRV